MSMQIQNIAVVNNLQLSDLKEGDVFENNGVTYILVRVNDYLYTVDLKSGASLRVHNPAAPVKLLKNPTLNHEGYQ